MHSHRRAGVLLALLVVLALGGCSSQSDKDRSDEPVSGASSGPDTTGSETTRSDTAGSETAGSDTTAPDSIGSDPETDAETDVAVSGNLQFEATALDGARFDGSSLAGKPTVFWFWAPWCPTCRGQILEVEAVAAQYAGDVNVVGVGGLDDPAAIEDFAADLDGMTLLVDDEGAIWQQFAITEQSSFVILDADGQEVERSGYGDDIDLPAEVADLLS